MTDNDLMQEVQKLTAENKQLREDLMFSVCYSPSAIRDSFDGADEDHPDAKWVEQTTDDQLKDISYTIIGSDLTWNDFHSNIEMCIEEVRGREEK